MGDRVQHIVEVAAGGAMTLADQPQRLILRQLAGELPVGAVGEVDQCRHRPAVVEPEGPHRFHIHTVMVDLAMDQVAPYLVVGGVGQPVRQASAGAARQQAEDQARLRGRAAIVFRVDAEGPVPRGGSRGCG
jgi:hypothetical protein